MTESKTTPFSEEEKERLFFLFSSFTDEFIRHIESNVMRRAFEDALSKFRSYHYGEY